MAQITQVITIHDYNKMTDEQKAALSENNMLAVVQQDWQQARIQAAIEFAAQILANHGGASTSVAKDAVDYADALITELKKGGQDE